MRHLLAVLLLGALAGAACTGPDDYWLAQLRASDPNGDHAMQNAVFGTGDVARTQLTSDPANNAEVYCYRLPDETTRWLKDIRAPMQAGQVETWHLVVTAGPSFAFGRIKLAGWNQPDLYTAIFDLNGSIPVKVVVVNDPSWPGAGSYAPGAVLWEFDPNVNGMSGSPTYTASFNWTGQQIRLDLVAGESGQTPVERTIGEARTIHVGHAVCLRRSVVTSTPADGAGLWLESEDGSSGVKVQASWSVSRGERLDVTGVVSWIDGVPVVTAPEIVTQTAGGHLAPRFAAGRGLANDPAETLQYKGINPVGLIFVVTGHVTAVDAPANALYLDDGSHLQDGMGPVGDQYVGLRVAYPSGITPPTLGSRVRVTGIRTVLKITLDHDAYVNGTLRTADETVYVPVVAMRDAGDLLLIHQ